MYDLNFFDAVKRQRTGNKAFRVFMVLLVVILIILNVVLIGGGLYVFDQMQKELDAKQNQINDLALQERIAEAGRIRAEAELVSEYLNLIQDAADTLDHLKYLDSNLLDRIRRLTPEAVTFSNLSVYDRQVAISCQAETVEDAMDLYHAFSQDPVFVNVQLHGISVDEETEVASFSFGFSVKED